MPLSIVFKLVRLVYELMMLKMLKKQNNNNYSSRITTATPKQIDAFNPLITQWYKTYNKTLENKANEKKYKKLKNSKYFVNFSFNPLHSCLLVKSSICNSTSFLKLFLRFFSFLQFSMFSFTFFFSKVYSRLLKGLLNCIGRIKILLESVVGKKFNLSFFLEDEKEH